MKGVKARRTDCLASRTKLTNSRKCKLILVIYIHNLLLIYYSMILLIAHKTCYFHFDRYTAMEQDGSKILGMVEENKCLLKVPDDSRHWDRYLLFLDQMITRGLVDGVSCR